MQNQIQIALQIWFIVCLPYNSCEFYTVYAANLFSTIDLKRIRLSIQEPPPPTLQNLVNGRSKSDRISP